MLHAKLRENLTTGSREDFGAFVSMVAMLSIQPRILRKKLFTHIKFHFHRPSDF